MKNLIVLIFSLFCFLVSAQDRFYYSETEYKWFTLLKKEGMPTSIDGMLYTRCISEDGHDIQYDKWIKLYPDGYEVYCGPCEIKINDYDAVEQVFISGSAVTSFVAPSWFRIDTITFDTVKVVMITTKEIYGQKLLVELKGYGVRNGWGRIKYLDSNKIPVKEVVWLSQEEDWDHVEK